MQHPLPPRTILRRRKFFFAIILSIDRKNGFVIPAEWSLGTEFTYAVSLSDRLIQEEQFSDIIIKSKEDGSKVLLGDIADINLGTENYNSTSRMNGKPAATIAIYQTPGTNALEVADQVKATTAELSQRFPDDIKYDISLDTTLAVTEGINEIVKTLEEAIMLVILVVFIFLQNWRATLIPLITVPVSLVGTFMVFPLLGFSVNVLSLLGLVLAIGICRQALNSRPSAT